MKINARYLAIASSLGAVLILFLLTKRDTVQTAAGEVSLSQPAPARENGTRPGRGAGAEVFSDDEIKEADSLFKAAARGDADLVPRARKWAGTNVTRRIWACDIARNAKRTDALAVLARDALEACRGGAATYGRLYRTSKFLEECRDWVAARMALDAAAPLAQHRTHREDIAFARLRIDLASEGATDERLAELRRISVSAAMNDNRLAAARLLKTYEH